MLDIGKIMNMTGRSEADVVAAISAVKSNDIVDVVAYLLDPPPVAGAKYIPPKPVIDDGLTPEVREKLKVARELAEILNARSTASPSPAVPQQSRTSDLLGLLEQQTAQVEEDEHSVAVSVPVLMQTFQETPSQTK